MRLHIVIDRISGEVSAQGRSGRRYSQEEIRRAEEGGRRRDPQAQAVLDDLDCGDAVDPASVLHDCEECRAASAAGHEPIVLAGKQLEAALADALREGLPWRWRRHRGRR